MRRRPFQIAVALVTLTLVLPAAAQESPAPQDHRAYFDQGRALVRDGRYAEALESFRRSLALNEGSGTLLNIGDCEEKLGRYASAITAFERAQAIWVEKNQPDREKEAAERIARVRPLVSTLTVVDVSRGSSARVELDHAAIDVGRPIAVDGGTHELRFASACRVAKELKVDVALKADAARVTIDPSTLSIDPACSPVAPANDRAPSARGSGLRTMALALGAAGILASGIGVGYGIVAVGKHDELESMCRTYPTHCPGARRADVDSTFEDARSAATVSTIAVVTGVALLGAAAVLYVLAPKTARPAAWAWRAPAL